jgi:hypothetical protein
LLSGEIFVGCGKLGVLSYSHAKRAIRCLTVIPAKAGIHRQCEAWIPAFAGMTMRYYKARRSSAEFTHCRNDGHDAARYIALRPGITSRATSASANNRAVRIQPNASTIN